MPGGLMQLKIRGARDAKFTGNPQITYFQNVYKRYTNFSMEYIELSFDRTSSLNPDQEIKTQCNIDRNAELLHDVHFIYDLPAIFNYIKITDEVQEKYGFETNHMYIPFKWVNGVGNKLIDEVTININSYPIDKRRGEFMEIYNHLTLSKHKKDLYDKKINGEYTRSYYTDISSTTVDGNYSLPGIPSTRLYIPLDFWFCKYPALSIPLIALQHAFTRLDFTLTRSNDLFKIGNPLVSPYEIINNVNLSSENSQIRDFLIIYVDYLNAQTTTNSFTLQNILELLIVRDWQPYYSVLANYIFLDESERRVFSQTSHEYLVDQVQYYYFDGLKRGTNIININMNGLVSEMIWFIKKDKDTETNDWFNFTNTKNPLTTDILNNIRKKITNITDSSQDLINLDTYKNLNDVDPELNKLILNDFNVMYRNTGDNTIDRKIICDEQWNYTDIMKSFYLKLNKMDRFEERKSRFYELLQVGKYHSGQSKKGLYVYSFSLNPEKIDRPSGTCNMSVIGEQQLMINIHESNNIDTYLEQFNLHFYTVGYNIFKIIGGIGSIQYVN